MTAVLLVACVVATAGCTLQAEHPIAASVDYPRVLTGSQGETLAAMSFRNYAAGITAFEGQLLGGESGDMALAGWIDFTNHIGYAKTSSPAALPILIAWDRERIAFLDVVGGLEGDAFPPPPGAWQTVQFDAHASELTRMLAALLLLSGDRPENPLLVKQRGARYLGVEEVFGAPADRFSGVVTNGEAEGGGDLGTQYWIDAEGDLVRFGLRVSGASLSVIEFDRNATVPDALPRPDSFGTNG